MAEPITIEMTEGRQLRVLAIIFGVLIAIIAAGYFLFLRLNYSLLYADLSMSDASVIVTELEAREVKFRLRNGGRDILVPAIDADAVRLGILDAEVPSKHLDGFELFNESEMGLTDFAQKIKFQRALQGELARTIMMIDGIENARVHIAIPERVLFRGEASRPTAAVTLVTRSGQFDETARISGIQRLVAASVPDLTLENVTVLNSGGEIISKIETPVSVALSEYVQVAAAYKDRLDIALALDAPDIEYDLKVMARPLRLRLEGEAPETKSEDQSDKGQKNYALRIVLTTDELLSDTQREVVYQIISDSAQIDIASGDRIDFKKRDLPLNLSLANSTAQAETVKAAKLHDEVSAQPAPIMAAFSWPLAVFAAAFFLLAGTGGLIAVRRRKALLTPQEHIEFAKRLRLRLQDSEV